MKKLFIISLVILLLLYGCLEPYPTINSPTSNTSVPTGNCTVYCMSQPYTQCVGAWNISGIYPNCSCQYTCNSIPAVKSECTVNSDCNCTSGTAICEHGNCSCVTIRQNTTKPIPPKTNKTVQELLTAGLDEIDDEVYANTPSGQAYQIFSYKWAYFQTNGSNAPPDITLGKGFVTTDLYFNNKFIPGTYAFALKVFSPTSGPNTKSVIKGLVLFLTENSLSKYNEVVTFNLRYTTIYPEIYLYGCAVNSVKEQRDSLNRTIYTYKYTCDYMKQGIEDYQSG